MQTLSNNTCPPFETFQEALTTIPWLPTVLTENPLVIFQESTEKSPSKSPTHLQWAPFGAAKIMRPYSDYGSIYLIMPLLSSHASEGLLGHPSIREFFNWDQPPPIAKVTSHLLKLETLFLQKAEEYKANKKQVRPVLWLLCPVIWPIF